MTKTVLKVLILEDNPYDAELNLKTLQKENWLIDSRLASDEKSFNAYLRDFDPDIVISDFNLPRFNGLDALHLCIQLKPLTPFIIVTGSLDEETAVDCIKQGAWDYVLKEHLVRLNPAVKNAIQLGQERAQRKLAQVSLRESEEHFRALTQNSPDVIMRFDKKCRHLFVNEAVFDLMKIKPDVFLNKSHEEMGLFTKDMCDFWESNILSVFETKKIIEVEFSVQTEPGPKYIEWRLFPEFDTFGEVYTVVAVARDITFRKEARDAIIRSEEQYRALTQNTPDVIMRFDRNFRHLFVNNAVFQQLAIKPEEFINKTHHEMGVFDNWLCDFWELQIKEVFETHKPHEVEFEIPSPTGKIYIEWRLFPEFNPQHEVLTVLAVARDVSFKKQTQEALRTNEERLNLALEATSDGLWDWNMKTSEIYYSPRYFTMLGQNPEDFKPDIKVLFDLMHPEDRERILGYINQIIESRKESLEMEMRMSRKDGSYAWILSRGKVFAHGENGEPVRMVGTHVDISFRKRQDAIQKAILDIGNAVVTTRNLEELFESIQNILGQIIDTKNCYIAFYDENRDKITLPFHRDEKDRFLEFPAGKSMTAYVIHTGIAQLFSRERTDLLAEAGEIENIGAPAISWLGVPLRIDKKIIGVFTVQSYDEAITYSEDDVKILEFVSDQIAIAIARKKDEDNIRENEQKQRRIIESSPDGLLVTSSDGLIIDHNTSAFSMLRINNQELRKQNFVDFVKQSDKEKVSDIFSETLKSGFQKNNVLLMTRSDNSDFYAEISLGLIQNPGNFNETFVIIFKDITDRINYESNLRIAKEKAEESDRLKSSFLSNMSHEIRTPMNAIVGFAELLSQSNLDESDRKEFISHINQGTETLLNLIDDIIDISKIEAGQIRISNSPFRLSSLLSELHGLFIKNLKRQNRETLELSIDNNGFNPEINIISDSFRLRQVLINLINNAIKFTDSGEVKFGIKNIENSLICFYVKDTGIGIMEDKHQLIFDRFRQGHESKTKFYGGTGLGLAISKHLVELMGGEISVVSEPRKGSEFIFTIEFMETKDEVVSAQKKIISSVPNWKNKTILLAEDETSNYLMLSEVLKDTLVKIIWAKDGREVIDLFKKHIEIDLVLMDIQLPILNGYLATAEIKKIRSEIPVIAQTAYAMSGEKEKSIQAGCNDYLSKPIKPKDLILTLSKFLKTEVLT